MVVIAILFAWQKLRNVKNNFFYKFLSIFSFPNLLVSTLCKKQVIISPAFYYYLKQIMLQIRIFRLHLLNS